MAMIGPSPIETVGNCQKSGISHGCGYDGSPLRETSCRKPSQLLLGQPPLEERAGVDARRRVALHVDEVAAVAVGRARCQKWLKPIS